MLRRDGTVVCYRIEKPVDGDWKGGYYTNAFGELSKEICRSDSYVSSGLCWQSIPAARDDRRSA